MSFKKRDTIVLLHCTNSLSVLFTKKILSVRPLSFVNSLQLFLISVPTNPFVMDFKLDLT